jgi:hypothetical protein
VCIIFRHGFLEVFNTILRFDVVLCYFPRLRKRSPASSPHRTSLGVFLNIIIIIIISLLISPLLGHRPSLWITGHNSLRGSSTDWWVLTTANASETNGLTCLLKLGGVREYNFLISHPMIDQYWLSSAIARRSALTAGHWAPLQHEWSLMALMHFKIRAVQNL